MVATMKGLQEFAKDPSNPHNILGALSELAEVPIPEIAIVGVVASFIDLFLPPEESQTQKDFESIQQDLKAISGQIDALTNKMQQGFRGISTEIKIQACKPSISNTGTLLSTLSNSLGSRTRLLRLTRALRSNISSTRVRRRSALWRCKS